MDGRPSIAGRCLIVALAVLASAPGPAVAETYTVTTPDDAGGCAATACASLRAALAVARDGDTIRLPAHGRRYAQQQQGPFVVRASVTIVGDGAGATVIGGDTGRTFVVGDPESRAVPTVVMANLQVTLGHDRYGRGGNILNYGTLTLDHVRVTQGVASRGGGVANVDGGKLTILNSLVDNNVATGSEWSGQGGGVYSDGYVADALVVRDSTVAFNAAESAGGIAVGSPGDQPPNRAALFDRVTIARNHATGASPGGLGIGAESRATLRGSILAANTAEVRSSMRSTAAPIPSNCGVPRPADGGGNLADTDDCGLAREAADPQLSAGLLEGFGQTPVLTIASGSPAVDIGGGCTGSDQRDLRRPQGEACDAGAFEVDAPVIHAGPSGPTADGSPAFVFSSEQPATAFECRLDGPAGAGSWQRCVSPMTYRGLAPGGYTFSVRPVGASAQASRSFTVVATAPQVLRPPPQPGQPAPTPAPTPTPTPRHRESVVVRPTAGAVKVRLPGTNRYTDLAAVDSIPLGSSIDVRKGRVRLYAIARRGGKPQAASFYGGVFRVAQRGSLIELQLRGPAPRCASGRAAASAAQSEPKRKRKARTRRLWGSGKGRFRTRGRYSAATVRGTTWLVEDRCRSTTTRVRRGAVTVRDFKLRRTVILRKGDRYVARKR